MGKKQCTDVKGKGKGKGKNNLSPAWVDGELKDMAFVIESNRQLLKDCRTDLEGRSIEKEGLEGEVRRAKIMLSDRQMMLCEGRLEVEKLSAEEWDLRLKLSTSSSLSEGDLAARLQVECDEVVFKIKFAERSVSLSKEVVERCEGTIFKVEGRLLENATEYNLVSSRVTSLESLLSCMEDQLCRMKEGGGNVLFPRPTSENPDTPLSTIHVLNACPVCCFWYKRHNFVPLGCGHTYHPWCLTEHAKTSTTCRVESCKEPLELESNAAIGIRLHVSDGSEFVVKTEGLSLEGSEQPTNQSLSEFVPTRTSESSGHQIASPDSFWGNEEPEKITQLSQSSETNAVAMVGPENAIEYQNLHSSCHVCKKKPTTVILKGCGHDIFCFGCIQGCEVCPACKKKIDGWEPIKRKLRVSPLLHSLGGAQDAGSVDPSTGKSSKMGTKGASLNLSKELPKLSDDGAAQNLSKKLVILQDVVQDLDDSDSEGDGFIHWCEDDEFAQGGVRSISEDPKMVEFNVATREQADEERTVVPMKKQSRPTIDINTLNHTRIVERALDEILEATPTVPELEKRLGEEIDNATTTTLKKKARRPRGGSKAKVSSIEQRRLAEFSQLADTTIQSQRSTPRTQGRQTIPAKFRGLA